MTSTAVQCPECDEVITVPIDVEIHDGDGQQTMTCEPDLADLWAHAWTHTGGAA